MKNQTQLDSHGSADDVVGTIGQLCKSQPDKATARPWAVANDSNGVHIEHFEKGNGYPVAYMMQKTTCDELKSLHISDDEAEANAALIVKAVNEYDALEAIRIQAQSALNRLGVLGYGHIDLDKALMNYDAIREGKAVQS